ncbi:MAG: hypothetical protein IJ150_03895 [Bacteroidales bacterium]|nr:hypothetical protein [Bacteroidales bacterium]
MKRLLFSIIAALMFCSLNVSAQVEKDTMKAGKLYFVNLKDGEKPVFQGFIIRGNRAGNQENGKGINSYPYSTDKIRFIFELNEWVEFYPQTQNTSGFAVWVFKHNSDQSFYLKNELSDELPDFVQYCEIRKDPEQEDDWHWGSFYLFPEQCAPGYYDFVFTSQGKVFATMITKFFKEEEL